jgi:hypothetical protein
MDSSSSLRLASNPGDRAIRTKDTQRMSLFFSFVVVLVLTSRASLGLASDCRPHKPGAAELQTLRIADFTTLTVVGDLAEFDPCDASTKIRKPFFSTTPRPLMIVIHGGGGLDKVTLAAADAFYELGFSTLVFDAFQMNRLSKPGSFFAVNVSNEARQRMIFKVAYGAYQWAVKNHAISSQGIFVYGISNGASVAANLAAIGDPAIMKMVFAEGAPGSGIGFPSDLKIPLRMIYGRIDNYGGRSEHDLMYSRRLSCSSMNIMSGVPAGTAENCNLQSNPFGGNTSPENWIESQRVKGADIELWWLESSAHGVFTDLSRGSKVFDGGRRLFTYQGGTDTDRQWFLDKIKQQLLRDGKPNSAG